MLLQTAFSSSVNKGGITIRVGHAYAEYAVHADYAHMRKYADADENLIHIIHI